MCVCLCVCFDVTAERIKLNHEFEYLYSWYIVDTHKILVLFITSISVIVFIIMSGVGKVGSGQMGAGTEIEGRSPIM